MNTKYLALAAFTTLLAGTNAFAQDETAAQENSGVVARDNVVVSDSVIVDDSAAEEQEVVSDWSTIETRKAWMPYSEPAARISGEVFGGVIAAVPAVAAGAILSKIADDGGLYSDKDEYNHIGTLDRAALISAFLVPFVESAGVHLVGSMLGNIGEPWTAYAGGAAGGAIGAGLGALGFLKSNSFGDKMVFVGALVGALVGAVTWYEISHSSEMDKYTISSVYPVVEVSDQRTVMGVGMEF